MSTVTWFRMYCAGRFGSNKADYLKGFGSLKSNYERLYEYDENKDALKWNIQLQFFQHLVEKIEKILKANRISDSQLHQIRDLLWEFESEHEKDFRKAFFEKERELLTNSDYPSELFNSVVNLLDHGENEEAVLTAFKFLDKHIQKLLSVQSHQFYGEDLVNYAFAPNSGILQLGTHPNEQVGLRNFFSGANALFRNPSAHRFMHYDDFTGDAIIAMIAMMANFVSELAKTKKKEQEQIPKE